MKIVCICLSFAQIMCSDRANTSGVHSNTLPSSLLKKPLAVRAFRVSSDTAFSRYCTTDQLNPSNYPISNPSICNMFKSTPGLSSFVPYSRPPYHNAYAAPLVHGESIGQPISTLLNRPEKCIRTLEVETSSRRTSDKEAHDILTDPCPLPITIGNMLDIDEKKRLKNSLDIWNYERLLDSYRKQGCSSYLQMFFSCNLYNSEYVTVGDSLHKDAIEKYIMRYNFMYKRVSPSNEALFAISSRTPYIYTKLDDWRCITEESLDEICAKNLKGYYSGLAMDIIKFMYKHGPILDDRNGPRLEWSETLGDIYVRKSIDSVNLMEEKEVSCEIKDMHNLIFIAVKLILSLPEVKNDFSIFSLDFVEYTLEQDTYNSLPYPIIIKNLFKLAQKYKYIPNSSTIREYSALYSAFSDILTCKTKPAVCIIIELYTKMYTYLTYFYEIARLYRKEEVNAENKYYMLEGKFIIKPQRYFRCTATLYLNLPSTRNTLYITERTNRWIIKPIAANHYHIHFVDNTKQQYRRLCMPMLFLPIQTIDQIVDYIERIFEIEDKSCIFPYIRDKQTGEWSYLAQKDRNRTTRDLFKWEVVFYYIEEGLLNNHFTFAEFDSYRKPDGEVIPIPLFLSPLARSLVEMGPFRRNINIPHALVKDMQFQNQIASEYTYIDIYKKQNYSTMHYYYSNLYIRNTSKNTKTIDCYIMNTQIKKEERKSIVTVEWDVRMPRSANEYTHCILDDSLRKTPEEYSEFIKAVQSQEYAPDSMFYGFELHIKENAPNSSRSALEFSEKNYSLVDKKVSILKISNKTFIDTCAISGIESAINRIVHLNKEWECIKRKEKQEGITEKERNQLKKQRTSINAKKFSIRKKIKKMNEEAMIKNIRKKKESSKGYFSPCVFLVFRNSNSDTKSSLGAINELFDAMTRNYSCLSL